MNDFLLKVPKEKITHIIPDKVILERKFQLDQQLLLNHNNIVKKIQGISVTNFHKENQGFLKQFLNNSVFIQITQNQTKEQIEIIKKHNNEIDKEIKLLHNQNSLKKNKLTKRIQKINSEINELLSSIDKNKKNKRIRGPPKDFITLKNLEDQKKELETEMNLMLGSSFKLRNKKLPENEKILIYTGKGILDKIIQDQTITDKIKEINDNFQEKIKTLKQLKQTKQIKTKIKQLYNQQIIKINNLYNLKEVHIKNLKNIESQFKTVLEKQLILKLIYKKDDIITTKIVGQNIVISKFGIPNQPSLTVTLWLRL